jgi:uncharacterized membrane protein YhfC
MDFSKYRVPGATMGCIFIALVIAFGLPIVLSIVWGKKSKAKASSFWLGAATFFVFALILESIVHNIVLKAVGTETFNSLAFIAVYGGLAAGLFEETGRFLVMKLFMKKTLCKKESIMFGIGHGGIESVLITGFTCISNLAIAYILNSGMGNLLTTGFNNGKEVELLTQLSPLWNSSPLTFLAGGLERISAVAFHICASYLVYRAIKDKKIYLYFLAILLHALMDGVMAVILRTTNSTLFTEIFIALFSLIFVIFTIKAYRKEKEETASLEQMASVE